jgi:hypothetical protein
MKLSFMMAVKFAILRRSALTGAISLSRCSSVRTKPEEALAVAVTSILLALPDGFTHRVAELPGFAPKNCQTVETTEKIFATAVAASPCAWNGRCSLKF